MATVNTRYVDVDAAAGGNGTTNALTGANCAYDSLSAWEAARQANIVTADVIEECIISSQDAAHTADTTRCQISGWTTDATRYIDIKVAAGSGHAGVYDTSKYRITQSGSSIATINVTESYVRLTGLQVINTRTAATVTSTIQFDAGATSDIRCDDLIGWCVGANAAFKVQTNNTTVTMRNCIALPGGAEGFAVTSFSGSLTCQNCAAVGCDYGFRRTSGTLVLTNCYAGGNATADFSGTRTETTNASSDTTATGTGGDSIAYTTSNFTNVTAGSEDLSLLSGSAAFLQTGGTDLSGTFTTDITGATRPTGASTWSIGPFQYFAAGGYTLTASGGSFAVTGTAANLEFGRYLSAGSGTYTLTGTAANLEFGRYLLAGSGTFTVTGTDATLTYGTVGGYTLAANGGTFTVTGTAANLEFGRTLIAGAGSYAVTGTAASLECGRLLSAGSGAFTLTGTAATLVYGQPGAYTLAANGGSCALTGTAATLTCGRRITATGATYTLTGAAAGLRAARYLGAASGSYVLTGTDAGLRYSAANSTALLLTDRSGARYYLDHLSGPATAITHRSGPRYLLTERDT